MDLLIYLTAALLLVSKFLDCYTTRVRIGGNIDREENPLANRIMKSININETIWLFFLIAAIIICFSTWLLFQLNAGIFYKIAFILTGLFITVVQFAVAHSNYYKRRNIITRYIKNIFQKAR